MSALGAAVGPARLPMRARLRDVVALGKPRLSSLVIFTAGVGLWLAPGAISPARALAVLLATAALVAAANAFNCLLERDSDARMHRTRERPLPAGRLEPRAAVAVGVLLTALSLPVLAYAGNLLTAGLGALAFLVYVAIYTPMKPHSTWALVVGAVPGAMPPLMGWVAVSGQLDAGGLALFAIMALWQLPHFLAVSFYLREDYARGGLRVFSLVHGERRTRVAICLGVVALIPASYLPIALGMAGPLYAATAALLGVAFLGGSLLGVRGASGANVGGSRWARGVFLASLGYLTVLFLVLLVPGA